MGRWLAALIDGQARWAGPLGEFHHRWLGALFGPLRPLKDLLNGTWLGHPLHGVLTDVPVGALTAAIVLDLLDLRTAADVAIVLGVLAMLASAAAGFADYADTDGRARLRGTVHSTLMLLSLLLYLVSLALRAGGPADRTLPVAVAIVGYVVLAAGAYVGGDVVYALGNMVDRHAFRSRGTRWVRLEMPEGEVPEGTLVKAKAGANGLVLVRRGDAIYALHDTCAHAGGPLPEGSIVGDCIECPWHGSRFRLSDGRLGRGPSVYDQPAYEVRAAETGGWEARRRS